MNIKGWGTDRPIRELLFEEGYRFDFFRAVQLLEMMHPEATSVGRRAEPEKEAVRFKSKVDTGFPATEIADIVPGPEGEPDEMTVNFLGLAGALGPLPAPYTKLIMDRRQRRDTAFKTFLDMFNHRLVSLLYRARLTNRVGLENRPAGETRFARYLFSLIGLGLPALRNRLDVPDRALLRYVGLLAQRPRSMKGLELLLTDYFGFQIKGRHLVGRWLSLGPGQWSKIGATGQNQVLGQTVTLGTRVWSQQSKFDLYLGPLSLESFMELLPIGRSFTPLCQLTRIYADLDLDFDVVLQLKADQAPGLVIGGPQSSRLGWTSWLKTGPLDAECLQVRLSAKKSDEAAY